MASVTKPVQAPLFENPSTHSATVDYVTGEDMDYLLGSVVKCVAQSKRGATTTAQVNALKKAKWYIDRKIELLEE